MNRCQKVNSNIKTNPSDKLEVFNNPEYIILPVVSHSKLYVNNKDFVSKNQIIIETRESKISCPISGQVVGTSLITINNNQQVKGIIIENDFREASQNKNPSKKHISNLTCEYISNKIEEFQLLDYRNKYLLNKKISPKIKYKDLLINGIENEPNVKNKSFILEKYSSQILEVIECLMNALDISKAFISIKSNDYKNIELYNNILGTYPEISLKIFPDLYPIGDYYILKENMASDIKNLDELLILDVEDLWHLYTVLKTNRYVNEQIITITGDRLSEERILNVKLGTKAIDILKFIDVDPNCAKTDFIANGLLKGHFIQNINNYVITDRTKAIFIQKKNTMNEYPCINCGKCSEVCPLGLDPRRKKTTDYCLKCNLCSYYCPSNIKFKEKGDVNEK